MASSVNNSSDKDSIDIEDSNYFQTALNSFLVPDNTIEQITSENVQSNIDIVSSKISDSRENALIFQDSIRSYLKNISTISKNSNLSKYYLSMDLSTSPSDSKYLPSNQLFVSGFPRHTLEHQLKAFFFNRGYKVTFVKILSSTKQNTGFGCAFVRFDSAEIGEILLDSFKEDPDQFRFYNKRLNIKRRTASNKQSKQNSLFSSINNSTNNIIEFQIHDVYYGTLITDIAMNKIISNTSASGYGLIANHLTDLHVNCRFDLSIDKQRTTITLNVSNNPDRSSTTSNNYKFKWDFSDLKDDKVSLVLINETTVGLLMQIQRPPSILHTFCLDSTDFQDVRLPGTPLLGHGNAWIFRLCNGADYPKLFRYLHRFNLTGRQFTANYVSDLLNSMSKTRDHNLRHIQFLSNEEWIKSNQKLVDDFLNCRWPQYRFETKFEIMKLLSKHIITVHDLIVDEQVDKILAQCSLNTLISCTDKIIEFAPYWLHNTCENDEEEKEEAPDLTEITDEEMSNVEPKASSKFVESALGDSIDVSSRTILSLSHKLSTNCTLQKRDLGVFSRFLLIALKELQKQRALFRALPSNSLIIKRDINTSYPNSILIRKIYITPCTVLYEGPYWEESCMVTRKFSECQHGFLRLTFRDEDYRKLQASNINLRNLYDRIKAILQDGIIICDRKYDFLAFSSSQLREHSCWMFSSMNGISVDKIRKNLGDFINIQPVAKYAARLGQSFSSTRKGIELADNQFQTIDDETRGKYCFTDGIGIIAPWLAEKLWKEVRDDPEDKNCPSAFQIRFGGVKGMVCLDVVNKIRDPLIGLCLRPSMKKFESINQSIDIVRVSSIPETRCALNRQIILLLSSLGIPNEIFLSMQEKMCDDLQALMTNQKEAHNFIRDLGTTGGNGYHQFLMNYLKVFGRQIDPFARQLLLAVRAFYLKELRVKAHILVPNTWNLLGVVDESRKLKSGQVFIQIEEMKSNKISTRIITGPVTVTRCPCFHPGDIRRLEAVDEPVLRQLKNVIVFPMNGQRPHPSEMSGGDLDGDTFWITCNEKLVIKNNEEPMAYDECLENKKKGASKILTPCTIDDASDFFGEYIEADNLGVIAYSHLAFADESNQGARTPKCLELANMYSIAVDFAKNGIRAPRLTKELRPEKYPHFMENNHRGIRRSTKILGQLYDKVKKFENDLQCNDKKNESNFTSFPYEKLRVDGFEVFINDAQEKKNEYDHELKRLMRQYGIHDEAELVSSYILKFTTKQYAKEKRTNEQRKEIAHAIKLIRNKYLKIFYEEFYHSVGEENTDLWSDASKKLSWKNQLRILEFYKGMDSHMDDIKKKASAWFHITYHLTEKSLITEENKHSSEDKDDSFKKYVQLIEKRHLLSFAWIVYPILLKIYEENNMEIDNVGNKRRMDDILSQEDDFSGEKLCQPSPETDTKRKRTS